MILFLKYTLEMIGVEINKLREKLITNMKPSEIKENQFYINYSTGIVFRLNNYINEKIDYALSKIEKLENVNLNKVKLEEKILSMKNNPQIIEKEKIPVNINYDEKVSELLIKESEKKSQTIDSEKIIQK